MELLTPSSLPATPKRSFFSMIKQSFTAAIWMEWPSATGRNTLCLCRGRSCTDRTHTAPSLPLLVIMTLWNGRNCIYEFSYDSDMCSELYCFTGMDRTSLIAEYIPYINGFSLFNYSRMQMKLFDCGDVSITPVFPEIAEANNMPPSHFHPHAHHPEECYIMYPHACYLVDPDHPDSSGTKMEYYVDKTAKLLPEGNVADKPHFRTSVPPVDGRFIVIDDCFIYEWGSEHARFFNLS